MRLSSDRTLGRTLAFAAVLEAGTGLALIAAPALVVALLLGAGASAIGSVIGRCFGIGLLALAMACWPGGSGSATGAPRRAMLVYNGLLALYLVWLGAMQHLSGLLLWPAAVLHAGVAILLAWPRQGGRQVVAGGQ